MFEKLFIEVNVSSFVIELFTLYSALEKTYQTNEVVDNSRQAEFKFKTFNIRLLSNLSDSLLGSPQRQKLDSKKL